MDRVNFLGYAFATFFGPLMIVFGERDDSPGGQFLGLALLIIGVIGLVKKYKNV